MTRESRDTLGREWFYALGCATVGTLILMLVVTPDYSGNRIVPFVVGTACAYAILQALRLTAWAYRRIRHGM